MFCFRKTYNNYNYNCYNNMTLLQHQKHQNHRQIVYSILLCHDYITRCDKTPSI